MSTTSRTMTVPESLPLRGVPAGYIHQPTTPDLASIQAPTLVVDGIADAVTAFLRSER